MKDNHKISDELKPLIVFTTSGGLAKLHKEFMEPSSDVYPIHNQVHHGLHFLIGTGIQIIICLWFVKNHNNYIPNASLLFSRKDI